MGRHDGHKDAAGAQRLHKLGHKVAAWVQRLVVPEHAQAWKPVPQVVVNILDQLLVARYPAVRQEHVANE